MPAGDADDAARSRRLCGRRQRSPDIERIQASQKTVGPAGQIRRGGGIEAGDCIAQRGQEGLDDRVEKGVNVGLRGAAVTAEPVAIAAAARNAPTPAPMMAHPTPARLGVA